LGGSAVISRQNVDLFGAWLSAEGSAATFLVPKPDSLKEADTSHIATVRDAKHLPHAGGAKEELQGLVDCRSGDTAALGGRGKSESELSRAPIGGEENADVPDELVGFGLSDPELDPTTGSEQGCFAHLGEKRRSLSFGHG